MKPTEYQTIRRMNEQAKDCLFLFGVGVGRVKNTPPKHTT
jgi:hypothetical protein